MVYKVQSKPYIIYNPTVIFRVAVTRIDEFMNKIGRKRGMSLTTGFDVIFDLNTTQKATFGHYYSDGDEDVVTMLCDEAQLPNVQSATGQLSGRYLGESAVQYPHSRMFTDVGLGFLCDAELTPLKFFNEWYGFIFGEQAVRAPKDYWGARNQASKPKNRENRLAYQDAYATTIKIMKTEPDSTASNGRAPITYLLENAYPYAIDAVPLSYGTSQITRVNVNFHYSRHTVHYGEGSTKSSLQLLSQNFLDSSGNINLPSQGIA